MDPIIQPSIDPHELRTTLGNFATGVTVVTCHTHDGGIHGTTVNSFTGVSLDPPLVLVSVNRAARMSTLLADVPFTVNVLHLDQRDVAMHFAGRPCLEEVLWEDAPALPPRIAGCLAAITCDPWRTYDGGDHVLVLGEVREVQRRPGLPLVFHTGEFQALHRDPFPAHWDGSGDGPSAISWISEAAAVLQQRI